MSQIAFFFAKSYDKQFFDAANQSFGYSINYIPDRLTHATAHLAKNARIVCLFVNDTVDQQLVDQLHQLGVELIALRSTGYNHVDLAATEGKLRVVRVPKYSPYSVAEHAVGLMLSLNRKIHHAYRRTVQHNFSIEGLLGFDMHGKTVGVVGLGKIGTAVTTILKGFGMRLLTYDIAPGLSTTTLDELYEKSDIITLHCPLTPDNHHLINRAAFAKMKKGVMLINTGRGGLIDTEALLENLLSHHVGSAGLDVVEGEALYFYEDCSKISIQDKTVLQLLTLPQVVITSHQAFFTREALENIAQVTLENIRDYLSGKTLQNEVTKSRY